MNSSKILSIKRKRGQRRKSSERIGRSISIPFSNDLVMFMKDARHQEHPLTVRSVLVYIKAEHPMFVAEYQKKCKEPYKSLLQLIRRIAYCHGLKQKKANCFKFEFDRKTKAERNFY